MNTINKNNNINFSGIHINKNVDPHVKDAIKQSKLIKNVGEQFDCYISQYQKYSKGDYGEAIEYGLKFKIKEIVPNLFTKKAKFKCNGSSDFALNPYKYKSLKEIKKIITEDLIHDIEILDDNFFKRMSK